ncbi:MAG TPA: CBS domain-containing protein [Candidatus Eremiobacteraceae bacterium]|nr:CBS domain-containing protein [Candidatus Baltobacteraceae bacterium]HYK52353.1 CBS domain-containing protein [Candidatus Eremiobacteraceae bacterium]
MAFTEGFISELVGRRATINDLPIGKVTDFLVKKPDATFPQIDGLVVKTAQGPRFAPIETVADVDRNGTIALTMAPKDPAPPEGEELYLVADLLDKQIVDVDGRKVVRINDIEVANAGGRLRVVAADVGVAGLLRRLGLRSFGKRFTPAIYKRVPRAMIAWDSVAPIREPNPSQVRLSVTESKLSRLHPSDLAEIIGDLSAREAVAVVQQLDDETAADAFEHLDAETQKSLIEDIGTERAADIIEEMDSDDAADLLAELPEDQQTELLAEMNAYTADELRELVKYAEDSAGGLMTTDYTWIYPHRTTEATIRKIREIAPTSEFIYYLYVVDKDDMLLGTLSLRTLLLALPTAFIDRIMDTDIVSVHPDAPAVDVAATIAKYDLLAVPVVDDKGKMLGIVTVDDAIDAIMPPDVAKKLPHFMARHHHHAVGA